MSGPRTFGVVAPAALDYLQRVAADPFAEASGAAVTSAPPALRRLVRIGGVAYPQRPQAQHGPPAGGEALAVPTEHLLTGLSGYRIPVAFLVQGTASHLAVHLGVWSAAERERARTAVLDRRREVLETVLRGLYPAIALAPAAVPPVRWPRGGLALGVPTLAAPDPLDEALTLDRLARAMASQTWAAVVLAEPVGEELLATLRHQLIEELRAVAAGEQASGAPSPLGKHYSELLEVALKALTEAQAVGGWRTAVYLLGDEASYPSLAAAWRSVLAGTRSLPEPIRVFDGAAAVDLAERWALPDVVGAQGPSGYRHPYACQTLLTSSQLAGMVQLPRLELPGFSVRVTPAFDAVPPPPPPPGEHAVALGTVLHRGQPTGAAYAVRADSLARHVFVAGMTGAGKTNTIFQLLLQADAAGVPFLVVEPAKTEYRALLAHPTLGSRLRVFTAGAEAVAPLRLNPFEVPPGTTVSQHLDLVRAAFGASFGMWTPLPQVLERCLHEVYTDRGWDLRTNANHRLDVGADPTQAFPTLTELVAKVDEVARQLGYEERITNDIRAALTTRLESLRRGGKGAMLDVAHSLPLDALFSAPCVLELEALGDEGDKAFLVALILIRLAEYRRAAGAADHLVHLLVIEEAHRLLANVPTQTSEEMANPRGQAVETFTNLLSEIRAYGQGVVIADQVPVRLAPDVIKNTNLKIAHRLVAADDRAVLGGAMAMDEGQARYLTILGVGEAAMYSDGDDAPVLVRVPLVKDALTSPLPDDATVAARQQARWRAEPGWEGQFASRPFCVETCAGDRVCAVARELAGDAFVQATLARTILATIEEADALDRLWDDLVAAVRSRRPPDVEETALLRALAGHGAAWYAERRGSQAGWSYRTTDELAAGLREMLLEKADGSGAPALAASRQGPSPARAVVQRAARRLAQRSFAPYPVCDRVCSQDPPLCLYRHAVADLVASGRYQAPWRQADATDAASPENRRKETWEVCQNAAYELIEWPEPEPEWAPELRAIVTATARRVCLCFEQQMLADDTRKVPRTTRKVLARVLAEAGL